MSSTKEYYISVIKSFVRQNIVLIMILASAAVVWTLIFSAAGSAFITLGERPFRSAWGGYGHFSMFGYTINFSFEGYADYDYFYYTWGQQFLRGFAPYSTLFNRSTIGNSIYYTPYFFPPLFVYLCAAGSLLPIDPFGIGFLIVVFGYLTAFPVYGISAHISNNRRIAQISTLTYLFNPIILYHTVYDWLNPAPFVFFMTLSFYLLIKRRLISGTLAMVTAALFKQIAFFLILPLIAVLIKKPSTSRPDNSQEAVRSIGDVLDLRTLGKMVLIAIVYVVGVSFPYLFNPANYIHYIFEVPGGFLLTDLTTLPNPGQPIPLATFLIYFGAPIELIDIVNKATYYGIFLMISIFIIFPLMLFQVRSDDSQPKYWRRILFLTLLLMLCVHLFSPRGVYKYYFVALIPFFSIQPASSMISSRTNEPKSSVFMILNPILLGLLIIIPDRNAYLAMVLLILLAYLSHRAFSLVYETACYGYNAFFSRLRESLKIDAADSPLPEDSMDTISP
jgi:hypothetical protein